LTIDDTDHIGDVNEMVLDAVSAVKTGRLGLAAGKGEQVTGEQVKILSSC
jgi:hypothetical protein